MSVWEHAKVGPENVQVALPNLCKALGIDEIYKNCQVRPTAIRKLKWAGFEDRTIMELTGHKKVETLDHYDPSPEISTKIERVQAIFGTKQRKQVPTSTITSEHVPTSTITSGQVTSSPNRIITIADVHSDGAALLPNTTKKKVAIVKK